MHSNPSRLFELSSTVMSSVSGDTGMGGGGGGLGGGSAPPPSAPASSPTVGGQPAASSGGGVVEKRRTAMDIATELDAAAESSAPAPAAESVTQVAAPRPPAAAAPAQPVQPAALPAPVRPPPPPALDPNVSQLAKSMAALEQMIVAERTQAAESARVARDVESQRAAIAARTAARESSKPRVPHPGAPAEEFLAYAEQISEWRAGVAAEDAQESLLSQMEEKYGSRLGRVEALEKQLHDMRNAQISEHTAQIIDTQVAAVAQNPQFSWMLDDKPLSPNLPDLSPRSMFNALWYGLNQRYEKELAAHGGAFHASVVASLFDRMVKANSGPVPQQVAASRATTSAAEAARSRQQAAGAPVQTVRPAGSALPAPGPQGPFTGRTRDQLPPGVLPDFRR